MLASSLVLSLALLPDAGAANVPKIKNIRIRDTDTSGAGTYKIGLITTNDDADPVESVEAELGSGATVSGVLDDRRLALTGPWGALSDQVDDVVLDLTDASGGVLTMLSGTLSPDGALVFSSPRSGEDGTCTARTGCDDPSTEVGVDIEVQAAWVVDGDAGLSFSLVLHGADVDDVAGAALTVTETYEGDTEVCLTTSRAGECTSWGFETYSESTLTDLTLGDRDEVWALDLPGDFTYGERVTVIARDSRGRKLDTVKFSPAAPWNAGATSALAVDNDPATSLALTQGPPSTNNGPLYAADPWHLAIVSEDWSLDDRYPASATIAVLDGETWEVPVHSYQVTGRVPVAFEGSPEDEELYIEQDGVFLAALSTSLACDTDSQTCAVLDQDEDGDWALVVTQWAQDPAELASLLDVSVVPLGAAVPTERSYTLDFGDTFAATFGIGVDFVADPLWLDLQAEVTLSSAADEKGKGKARVQGAVYGQFDAGDDGLPGLSYRDAAALLPRGDILIGGEPIDFEMTAGDRTVRTAPPVIQYLNGKGTKNSTSTAGQTLEAELL